MKLANKDAIKKFFFDAITPHFDSQIRASELFGGWKKWCEENNYFCFSQTWFGTRLSEMGVHKRRRTRGQFYLGLKWKEAE